MRIFKKTQNFWEIFQNSKLHFKTPDIASAHGKKLTKNLP